MNKPKTVQIAAVAHANGHEVIYALRDDGTIWRKHDTPIPGHWQMVEVIPDSLDDEPAMPR